MRILGTQTDLVGTLNEEYIKDEGVFRRKVDIMRQEREKEGQDSMCSRL